MTRLRRWTMAIVAVSIAAAVQATPQAQVSAELIGTAYAACKANPAPRCWAASAEQLSRLDLPKSTVDQEKRLFDFVMLGRLAHATGDYTDARLFYDRALSLAKSMKGQHREEGEANFFPMLFKLEETELAMSMRDYDAALEHIDAFLALSAKDGLRNEVQDEFSMLRCGALIGQRRKAEADRCLQTLLERLNFDGRAPWEAYPIGPQGLNPFEAARRIAAHEARERRFDSAMNLLLRIEAARENALRIDADAVKKEPWLPGKPWAAFVEPADIMEDKAAIFLAQGDDARAAPLLLAASTLRRSSQPNPTGFHLKVDPLAETLGFLRAH
jgi:tetratricopeptide (TPR) repeat protein